MHFDPSTPLPEWFDRKSKNLESLIREVKDAKRIAVDTETTGLVRWKDMPKVWSMSLNNRRICLNANTLPLFRDAFEDESKEWVFANAKFDAHMFANYGTPLKGKLVDVQVMHGMLYDTEGHGLKEMAKHLIDVQWEGFMETFPRLVVPDLATNKKRKQTPGEMLDVAMNGNLDLLVNYASMDAWGTFRIFEILNKELEETPIYSLWPDIYGTMYDLFWKVEVPFTRVLWKCERNGCLIDTSYLEGVARPIDKRLKEIEKEACQLVGRPFNLGSKLELHRYFFEEHNCKPLSMTDGGASGNKKPKIDDEFLVHYRNEFPLADLVLDHADAIKTKSTYVEGIIKKIDYNSRLHTILNQIGAKTGRLSSSNPNLQNIPNPESDQYGLRMAFIAGKGKKLICSDYNALEMRLLAAASLEKDMIQIFLDGKDIHMGNASLVYGIPYEDIKRAKDTPKDQQTAYMKECLKRRSAVKIVGFGLNYGMQPPLLAKNLGCSIEVAEATRNAYLNRLPAVRQYYDAAIQEVYDMYGQSFSLMGRRRMLSDILSDKRYLQSRAERQATNMPIQGGAADVVRAAMVAIDALNLEKTHGAKMLLQVHDEILFDCPEETAQDAERLIVSVMENALPTPLAVPLTVASHRVDRWGDAK